MFPNPMATINETSKPSKAKLKNVEIFFSIIIPKEQEPQTSEFETSKEYEFKEYYNNTFKHDKTEYKLSIYYSPFKNENNKESLETVFKLNKTEYSIKMKIKSEKNFVFKPDVLQITDLFSFNIPIEQNKISYKNKCIGFIRTLTKLNKEEYLDELIDEGINTFEGENTIDYFILLFSRCYNKPRYLYKLFSKFPKDFKLDDKESLKDLIDNIDIIYKEKNNIFNLIQSELNKEKEKQSKKKDNKTSKELTDKFENLYYYIIIYYFLLIDNKTKAFEIINELHTNNKKILFHIVKHYSSSLKNFDIVSKDLANEILSDTSEGDFENMENILQYYQSVSDVLELLDSNKDNLKKLADKAKKNKKNNIINILYFVKQNKNDDITTICKKCNNIIDYQKEKDAFFIIFKPDFWKYYNDNFTKSNLNDIDVLIELRKTLHNYNKLMGQRNVPKNTKKDFDIYFSKDDYGSSIHNKIISNIENNKYTNLQLLTLIFEKDPYYKDPSLKDKRDIKILNYFDFQKEDDEVFVNKFIDLELDKIFENEIEQYFKHFFSFVKNIFDFKLLFKLFNVEKMKENTLNKYIEYLKVKFREINIKLDKENETQNKEIIKYLVILIDIIVKKKQEKVLEFFYILEEKCKEDIYHIYIQLLEVNEDLSNEKLLNYIFSKIKDSDDSIYYSIKLLSKIKSPNTKKKFFESNKKNIIEMTDFFSDKNNKKINLYIALNKNQLFDENTEYYKNNKKFLDELKEKINTYKIKKSEINLLLKNTKEKIIEKLSLIDKNPEILLNKLISNISEINKEIEDLRIKKDFLSYYHKNFVENQKELKIVSSSEEQKLNEIIGNIGKIKEILNGKNEIIEKVKLVKDSILFNMIYKKKVDKNDEKNEDKIFNDSLKILDSKINLIKEPEEVDNNFRGEFISNFKNNDQLKKEIIILGKYFKIENLDVELIIDKINVIQNIKQYIKEIENILLFMDKIRVKKTDFYEKLNSIITKMKSLNNEKNIEKNKYNRIKEDLDYLKSNKIYDYKDKNENLDIFRYLRDNALESINYLLQKDENSAKILEEKLDPMETTLTSDDIMFFVGCTKFIKSLNIQDSTDIKVFYEIKKKIEEDKEKTIIAAFKNYSNNFKLIKELEIYSDDSNSIMNNITNNINTGVYYFYKKYDQYKNNNELINNGYDYLYDLKCKIKCKINIIDEKKDNTDEMKKVYIENLKEKNRILEYFEDIVDCIRIIKFYVEPLRNKGCQIELYISVHFCYDKNKENGEKGKFFLGEEEKSFEEIKQYLIDVTNFYNQLLIKYYKENEYIRFSYGKQFNYIVDYLSANNNDNSFAYYFLNNIPKNELYRAFSVETSETIKNYKNYLENSLKNIIKYIQDYFIDNYETLEIFYEKNCKVKNKKSGLYHLNCDKKTIEEKIIDLFVSQTDKFPISQNILLINKTTSFEEMESFLYRAILCNYNTLFIIGLNNFMPSQGDYLMKITKYLINYIKERDNPGSKTKDIEAKIKSCIIFLYKKERINKKFIEHIRKIARQIYLSDEKNNKDNESKINKINSIKPHNHKTQNDDSSLRNSQAFTITFNQKDIDTKKSEEKDKNVFIYKSDINGTGKSFEIKKEIDKKNMTYKYFPFGGFLNKEIVYNKIKKLLEGIKNEDNNKISIHLDLYETEQQDIMNDFLFSFLYIKYYKNDEKVIYIPREISIYVEIPNCFRDFIETYPILRTFTTIEIDSKKLPKLNLNEKEKNLFKLLEIKDVDSFVKKNIGIENPSYYQIKQFINSFLSQISGDNIQNLNNDTKEKIIASTRHFTKNPYSNLLKENNAANNVNEGNCQKSELTEKDILEKLSLIDNDTSKKENIKELDKIPLVFYNTEKSEFFEVSMSEDDYKNYKRKKYLKDLKKIFNLKNPIENKESKEEKEEEEEEEESENSDKIQNENENSSELLSLDDILGKDYVITVDNFRKMVKIYYRIISNLNLIIMGETGCGKTLLISKIYELLNNGRNIQTDNKLNIHGGFTDDDIIKKIKIINENAKKISNKKKTKIWVFIDEINSCKSMGLFNEIICNHSCNGETLEPNLIFIGACNPYRKSKSDKKYYGLIHSSKKDNNILYNVNPLSHSLMNFVYYFGSLEKEDEKKYIEAIIEKIFLEDEVDLKKRVAEMLLAGHVFVRDKGDVSSVSLREINRFIKCFDFFKKYFENKKEVMDQNEIEEECLNDELIIKKKSIILSLYTCYYLKISNNQLRGQFDTKIKGAEVNDIVIGLLDNGKETFYSEILKNEEKFIINQVELKSGIAENRPLRDNIFLLFVAINLNIPIFIIGKPGSSKTLSVNLLQKEMDGKYSKKNFFKKYPPIYRTWFQGSELTTPQEVENLFDSVEKKAKKNVNNNDMSSGQHPIYLIFFDEIGLCEISDKKPLKILNFKFEYESKQDNLSFIGISNWILDASKMNRGFTLCVPELHENLDDMEETCKKIVLSINPILWSKPYDKIFKALYNSYMNYKKKLEDEYKINESDEPLCHGSRDFYYLIKNVAYNLSDFLSKNKNFTEADEIEFVTSAIERNFDSLHLKKNNKTEESIKVFKEIYLKEREKNNDDKFKEFLNKKKDVIKNIISNIQDKQSRNLLLITKSSLNILLVETLLKKLKETNKKDIELIHEIGSPFEDDESEEYKLKAINKIQEHAKKGRLLILQKFSNIFSSFYELFNLNYIRKEGKNYARIAVGKSREQLIEVNENFKVILLFDKEDVKHILQPIASRFEKIEVEFSNLLTEEEINEADSINSTINGLTKIKLGENKSVNYDLNNLIVNLDKEEIQSMIYYCRENKDKIKDHKSYIYEKIIPTLPQDIIGGMMFGLIEESEEIKKIEDKLGQFGRPKNINEFLEKSINSKDKFVKLKFNIIYTFSDLSGQFDVKDEINNIIDVEMESSIKSESNLEIILKNFYSNKNLKYKIFKIHANSIEDIIYLRTFIKSFDEVYKYNEDYNYECEDKKYIFTVHILRKVITNENKNYKKKLNSISFTSDDVQHLFIDNLNGNDITLKDIKDSDVSDFIQNKLKLNKEFCLIALDFFNKKTKTINSKTKGIDVQNFMDVMQKYLEKKNEYKNDIIKKLNNIIIHKIKVENVFKQMLEEGYVKNKNIDIVDTLIKYIKHIYKKESYKLLNFIENNYFLTSIMVINTPDVSNEDYFNDDKYSKKNESQNADEEEEKEREEEEEEEEKEEENEEKENNNSDKKYIENKIIKKISYTYLELLEKKPDLSTNRNNNLCILYKIPGFFTLYQDINRYIRENLKDEFFQNEREFRFSLPKNEEVEKLKYDFHQKEETFLENLFNNFESHKLFKILIEENNLLNTKEEEKEEDEEQKDFNEFMDLLLKDYITFYLLQKYHEANKKGIDEKAFEKYDYNPYDVEHDLIQLLINIRLKEDKKIEERINIVKINKDDALKLFLFKILWIESNYDYIINILKVYNILSSVVKKEENSENYFFNNISDYIRKRNVRYIAQEKRNPQHTEEINECFYILLASICQCVTDENSMDCNDAIYYSIPIFKESLQIIDRLSDDLLLYLNEKYIIEEFLLIIRAAYIYQYIENDFPKNILKYLKDLSFVIQAEPENKIVKLNKSFLNLNKYIINQLKIKNDENDNFENNEEKVEYKYSLLSSFYLSELRRLSDINYKANVLEQILMNDKVIKKSLESFKILFKNILQPEIDKFENILINLTNKSDIILQMIEKKDSIALNDTLFYLFEKNSFIYFEKAENVDENKMKKKFATFYEKKKSIHLINDEPLLIFENCIKYLESLVTREDNKTKNKKMKKLFCLAYIRVFIYKFVHIIKGAPLDFEENKIIEVINGKKEKKETELRKMIKLYLYKVVFNINGNNVSNMKNEKIQKIFKLKEITGFSDFVGKIGKNKVEIFLEKLLLPRENIKIKDFQDCFLQLQSDEKDKFKDENNVNNVIGQNRKNEEDMYYLIYSNILSKYLVETINNNKISLIQQNFWNNYLDKIYKKDSKKLLKTIFNPDNLKKLAENYNIQKNHIEMLLYSMRFCFKTLNSSNKKSKSIYKAILFEDKYDLNDSYLVGNDISENNYFEIYLLLKEHFKKNPEKGAYVCLCKEGYYHCVSNGYPTEKEICPKCEKPIGLESYYLFWYYPVKRNDYVRIFKSEQDIIKEPKDKLKTINYMTLDKFYEKHIIPAINNEQPGISQISREHFSKSNKIIRKLKSQITYRLLNFVLYSHLFFSEIMNEEKKAVLPRSMNFIEVLKVDWDMLKEALEKEEMEIEIYINLIFNKLTDILTKIEEIKNIDNLMEKECSIENDLESCKNEYRNYKIEYEKLNKKLRNVEFDSPISLLQENFDLTLYKEEHYPFYKYFLFTNYILENNLEDKNVDQKFIMLKKYVNKKENGDDKKARHLESLILFNKVNNLLYEEFSNKILRKTAEEKKLVDSTVYNENKSIFNAFFSAIKNKAFDDNLTLNIEDSLSKFLIDKNSDESKKLIDVYKKYIKEQNELIEKVLKEKHSSDGFPIAEKISVQSVRSEEIFTFKFKKTCLTEIIFENSFREKSFKNLEVNYDRIEDILTNTLLGKVKMFGNNINYVIYSNEAYLHENTSIINNFIKNYQPLEEINKDDKKKILKSFNEISNKGQCLNIIKDFYEIIINLNRSIKSFDDKKIIINNYDKIKEKDSSQDNKKNENDNEIKQNNEDDENNNKEEGKEEGEEEETHKENENIESKNNEENKDNMENIIKERINLEKIEKERINKEKSIKIIDIIKSKSHSKIGNDNFSNEFNILMGDNDNFTLKKLISIFIFSEKLMFLNIFKKEYNKYLPEKESEPDKNEFSLTDINKKQIDDFYKEERLITKEIMCSAIRRYLTRYLSRENDLEKYFKNNKRNFIKNFYIDDLWDYEINKKEEQKEEEIKLIKNINIEIKQIISLYDYLEGDSYIKEELNELKDEDMLPRQIINEEVNEDKKSIKNEEEENSEQDESEENEYVNDYDDERD